MTELSSPSSPSAPKSWPSGLTLLRWAFLDPQWLESFSKKLTYRQKLGLLLKAYFWVITLTFLLYLGGITLAVIFDPPLQFLSIDIHKEGIAAAFQNAPNGWARAVVLVSASMKNVRTILGPCLAGGLGVGLVGGSLAGSFIFCIGFGFANNLMTGTTWGLVGGLFWGLVWSPTGGERGSLAASLVGGLIVSLAWGFDAAIGFYLGFFRLPFYLWHLLSSRKQLDFAQNPYRRDAVIWFPLWGVSDRLAALAQQQPEAAREFVEFLRARRPLQRKLAVRLAHAATAGA